MNIFKPIIYVRGYAMTSTEMVDTVADPYMGFNIGSTKLRQSWDGKINRHIFESPMVRLMKDYGYQDVFEGGREDFTNVPEKPVIIYRYYEKNWNSVDNDDETAEAKSIVDFASGLENLILKIKEAYCQKFSLPPDEFKVHLVAHSMGGLVCRCFLQNSKFKNGIAKNSVDKVFTYATPHNGIDMIGVNVPRWLGIFDISNFNRKNIKEFLQIKSTSNANVNTLDGEFPEERFFSLVGTDSRDYHVASNISKTLTGFLGDGLVRIENAYIDGGPRAYVHRSHSGHYGIVNSEEGYQNLTRFLFGDIFTSAKLKVNNLPLTKELEKAKKSDKKIRGSYFFEVSVAPRGSNYYLDQRLTAHKSAIFRTYDEMFKPADDVAARMPTLFSVFLDSTKAPRNSAFAVFVIDLRVKATDFEVDGVIWDKNIPDYTLFDDRVVVSVPIKHKKSISDMPSMKATLERSKIIRRDLNNDPYHLSIQLSNSRTGFDATLEIEVKQYGLQKRALTPLFTLG
jgi:hypothetical protein